MIEAERLTMQYGSVTALADASFRVKPKEVVGLLGPNGAGKSTTLKILTTYLWPTSGTARVCGKDVLTEPLEVRKRIGYLPEQIPLYMDMEVREYLEFVGGARELEGARLKERIGWVMERCGLKEVWPKPVRELSKGYRQRTALAQALIHDPEVVILDEPTSGLDPHQIIEIRKLVRELADAKTVILSTHILQEVEAVADRIVIISRGEIVADGTPQELRRQATKLERVELAVAAPREEAERVLRGSLRDAKTVQYVDNEEGVVRFRIQAEQDKHIARQIGVLMKEKGWEVSELRKLPLSLEETFLALTEAETVAV